MSAAARAVAIFLVASWLAAGRARAAEGASEHQSALFALIIGVNASPSPDVAPLKYADDDAARYVDLFRALGARTYLLAQLDDQTRRLHPQAAAEAQPARREEMRNAVAGLTRDVAQARARGVRSILYVIYAGHGDVHDATERLTLDDGTLDGAALLSEVVSPPGADQSHVIIDACQAYLLAYERGAGGARRPVRGFVELEAASRRGRIGFLLSSSSTGETHEWAGFEAGVFSHEVRSGLYGAADADGDGIVTYTEIAAFVTRANAEIVNDRFRPEIIARAPAGGDTLLDLRRREGRELRIQGPAAEAHYLLEDMQGVRLLDFHGSAGTPVRLTRPAVVGPLYLRRVVDGAERTVPPSEALVDLGALPVEPARAGVRGAAQHAFSSTFALPFDGGAVSAYAREADLQAHAAQVADDGAAVRERRLRLGERGAWALAASAAIVAGLVELSALSLRDELAESSQAAAAAHNEGIATRNHVATAFAIGSVAAAAAGVTLHVLGNDARVGAAAMPAGPAVDVAVRF